MGPWVVRPPYFRNDHLKISVANMLRQKIKQTSSFPNKEQMSVFGPFWLVLGVFGSFQVSFCLVLGCFGSFWVVLTCFWSPFGSSWLVLTYFGSFWLVLGFLLACSALCWVVLVHFRSPFDPFWVVLGCFGLFWVFLGRFTPPFDSFWLAFGCFGLVLPRCVVQYRLLRTLFFTEHLWWLAVYEVFCKDISYDNDLFGMVEALLCLQIKYILTAIVFWFVKYLFPINGCTLD